MARSSRTTSVYDRIAKKMEEIKMAEAQVAKYKEELDVLHQEQDELEMHQLLNMMKSRNMDIKEAVKLFDATDHKDIDVANKKNVSRTKTASQDGQLQLTI